MSEKKAPEGYKQTEIGIIPDDWETTPLEEITDIKTGPFGSALHADDYVLVGTPIITVEHLGDYSITYQSLPLVSNNDKKRLGQYVLKEGDIVFSRVGSVDRNSYITEAENGWLFSGRLLRIRSISEKINTRFLGFYFKYEPTRERVRGISVGQTMASLNTKLMNTFQVVLPLLSEQTAIAEALSDVDALIESLEKLIEKKKAIKKGAMQELLRSKEGWEVKKLGEVAEFYKGSGLPKSNMSLGGNKKCIHYGELFTHYKEKIVDITNKTIQFDGAFYSCSNDVLMPTSDVTPNGLATASCIFEDGVILGGDILVIRISNIIINGVYLSYFIKMNRSVVMKLVKGVTVYHLHASDMKDFIIKYPKIENQNTIAAILSDMDVEIDALMAKLHKVKLIKQGMMQELLTGKIRLKTTIRFDEADICSHYAVIISLLTMLFTDKNLVFLSHLRYQKIFYLFLVLSKKKTDSFAKLKHGPFSKYLAYTVIPKAEEEKLYLKTDEKKNIGIGQNIIDAVSTSMQLGYYQCAKTLSEKCCFYTNNYLEILTTAIESIRDLEKTNQPVSLGAVKKYIHTIPQWKHKLELEYFNDKEIEKAIHEYYDFFT